MVPAWASRAPWITDSPTPPTPITATDAPADTCAVFNAAPTPVSTPHPSTHARSRGMSERIFTMLFWPTSMYSPNPPSPTNWFIGSPPLDNRLGCDGSRAILVGEAHERAARHAVRAVTAERREARDDVVPRSELPDAGSDRLHHPCGLVTEHERRRERACPCRATRADRCGTRRWPPYVRAPRRSPDRRPRPHRSGRCPEPPRPPQPASSSPCRSPLCLGDRSKGPTVTSSSTGFGPFRSGRTGRRCGRARRRGRVDETPGSPHPSSPGGSTCRTTGRSRAHRSPLAAS